ncbi:hypothetical protein Dda_4738 [Drechslerella dactyloides]|uniref:Uncharacterized protein n=1 Tax=Drechslerella dactyloides TaxID=74499 RepID=A0AAD6NJI3_DREDA|nr:hypothetical protein Dda_4738 [Drechslerella dactyloides]
MEFRSRFHDCGSISGDDIASLEQEINAWTKRCRKSVNEEVDMRRRLEQAYDSLRDGVAILMNKVERLEAENKALKAQFQRAAEEADKRLYPRLDDDAVHVQEERSAPNTKYPGSIEVMHFDSLDPEIMPK